MLVVVQVVNEILNFTKTEVSLLCIKHLIFSEFSLLHYITPHFEIHFNIIPMSDIFSQVVSIILDCLTKMLYSVILYYYHAIERGTRYHMLNISTSSLNSSSPALRSFVDLGFQYNPLSFLPVSPPYANFLIPLSSDPLQSRHFILSVVFLFPSFLPFWQ